MLFCMKKIFKMWMSSQGELKENQKKIKKNMKTKKNED